MNIESSHRTDISQFSLGWKQLSEHVELLLTQLAHDIPKGGMFLDRRRYEDLPNGLRLLAALGFGIPEIRRLSPPAGAAVPVWGSIPSGPYSPSSLFKEGRNR
jgi:hypothetical protein